MAAGRPLRIALVAGEDSGDLLAAGLVRELARRFPDAQFAGIGGPRLRAVGMDTWHDCSELAVMGLAEVLRHLPRLLRLRRGLARRLLFLSDEGLDEAITLMETVLADHEKGHLQPQPIHRITLAEALMTRGRSGDLPRARQLFEQNEIALRAYPPTYSMAFYNRYLMADVTRKAGDPARAAAPSRWWRPCVASPTHWALS